MNLQNLFLFLFIGVLTFPLQGESRKTRVVATTTIIYDLAKNIAGNEVEVISFLPFGADPHNYEPRPSDIRKFTNADIILRNGLYLEGWLDKVIAFSGTRAQIYTVTTGIPTIESEEYPGSPDPHVWMTATNGIKMAENIAEALSGELPGKAPVFRENLEQYRQKLEELDKHIFSMLETIPKEKRILITTHDAFRYFGNHYGLRVESAIGISPDAEVQYHDMQYLVRVIRQYEIPAIFVEYAINPKLFHQIARDYNIAIGGELFADSIGDEDSEANSYHDMLYYNTELIVSGLTGNAPSLPPAESNVVLLSLVFSFFLLVFFYIAWKLRKTAIPVESLRNAGIRITHLNVSYDKKTVLSNINLEVTSGKITGLIGPNGSGKSTLMKSILGLTRPDTGTIEIGKYAVEKVYPHIAYIPQKEEIDFNFPATVMEVVLNGRYPHKQIFSRISKTDYREAEKALQQVDLSEYRNRQIGQLSGGQQQRVFLARAICQNAHLYLLDEPFVGVDATTEKKIIQIIRNLAGQGKIILIIHHDLAEAKNYFDEIILLNQRLIAMGKPQDVLTSENIQQTYSAKLSVIQKTDKYVY